MPGKENTTMADSPEKEREAIVAAEEHKALIVKINRARRRKRAIKPIVEGEKVPHETRHAHTLRHKAAIKPGAEERKRRQRKSRHDLKKSVMKPSSGHKSPRPNRRKKQKANINAK